MFNLDDIPVWQSSSQYKQIDPLNAGLLLYGLQLAKNGIYGLSDSIDAALDDAEFQLIQEVIPESETMQVAMFFNSNAPGINGGTSIAGSWQNRMLNGIELNANFVLPFSNPPFFSLTAGTYLITGFQQFFGEQGRVKTRLYNHTGSYQAVWGNSTWAASNVGTAAVISGSFVIEADSQFSLQYRVGVGFANSGLGLASNYGDVERYANLTIWRMP